MLGEKLIKTIDDGKEFDVSELTYPDVGIINDYAHLNLDSVTKEIVRLEKEADEVEMKLKNMSVKERALWDKHYPFSITRHDLE